MESGAFSEGVLAVCVPRTTAGSVSTALEPVATRPSAHDSV
jgi:hypothetical protein